MIDTHCHVDFESYDAERDEVLARADAAGVTRIVNPAIDLASCHAIRALTERHAALYGAIGIHPNSTADFSPGLLDAVADLAIGPKIVAIGEIGLDYYRDRSPRGTQRAAFEAQLALAARLALPVIIHNRDASEDVLAVLEAWAPTLPPALRDRPGVLHSFAASWEIAERALRLGFYVGFTGPVTYKKADDLRAVAARVPLDRLLVETDGPFLPPVPYRGQRNEPAYIPLIVAEIARARGLTEHAVAAATTANATRLFPGLA